MEEVEIIYDSPEYRDDIKRLNVEWLELYFVVEPLDFQLIFYPKGEIIDKAKSCFIPFQKNYPQE